MSFSSEQKAQIREIVKEIVKDRPIIVVNIQSLPVASTEKKEVVNEVEQLIMSSLGIEG